MKNVVLPIVLTAISVLLTHFTLKNKNWQIPNCIVKMIECHNKIIIATKWSTITEIAAKLVTPVTTMVLARLLSPEAFGIMVTAIMIISFAEVFTDAGFQKYIIQHKFETYDDLFSSTNVAFWSNLLMSVIIWAFIIVFSPQIANLVGNPGKGSVIAVSCVCIPLSAFSSIQMALYKRELNFKTLFWVRIIGVFLHFVITIPLAWYTRNYWALIIGHIAFNLSNAILLMWRSKWKPRLEYRLSLFKKMLAFTSWSMIEALAIWITSYADIFIVGTILDQYHLGLYRTSIVTVGQIIGIVTAPTTSILFSSLSKVQDDEVHFKSIFLEFQHFVGMLIIPFGIGIFIFRELLTDVILGKQWEQSAWFIGLWGLTGAITIMLSHYCSEIYRSKGCPKLSVLAQVLHTIILIPAIWWAANFSYDFLCDVRASVRITSIIINLTITYYIVKISPLEMIGNISLPILASAIMGICGYVLLTISENTILQFVYIIVCSLIYIGFMLMFPKERKRIVNIKNCLDLPK